MLHVWERRGTPAGRPEGEKNLEDLAINGRIVSGLKELELEGADWACRRAVVNTLMNSRVL